MRFLWTRESDPISFHIADIMRSKVISAACRQIWACFLGFACWVRMKYKIGYNTDKDNETEEDK